MKKLCGLILVFMLLLTLLGGCQSVNQNPLALSISPNTAKDPAALQELKNFDINIIELTSVHGIMHDEEAFAAVEKSLRDADMQVNSMHYPYGPSFDISNLDEKIRLQAIKEIKHYLQKLARSEWQIPDRSSQL